MYLSLIISFLLLLVMIVASMQNSMILNIKFITLNIQISFSSLVIYFSVIGGAIVAVLILPKLVKKSLQVRSLNREIHKMKENMTEMGQEHRGGSQPG